MTILGTLDIRAWDTGAVVTLGGEITDYEVDGGQRQVYAIDVPGLDSGIADLEGKVPVHFAQSEDVYTNFVLPCFTIRRNELTPAFDRKPWYGVVARRPAKDAEKVVLPDGRTGYTKYENQWRGHPFDISYDLMIHARREQEIQAMLMHTLRHYKPPWFVFKVVDSLGEVRQYDAGEVSVSNSSEIADIADRMVGYTITFTVRSELDLEKSWESQAVTQDPIVTYQVYRPSAQGVE